MSSGRLNILQWMATELRVKRQQLLDLAGFKDNEDNKLDMGIDLGGVEVGNYDKNTIYEILKI